ncbi:GATOR complex protein Iml1 isoform X2 [Bacillus rossius redtenbacheri]|uniref:GATOR complex protein Iml1 isoform X2 n=1 Tax=Bacillus rossius redtenbacheri TaxID=93214 RepID=UPI002FDD4DE2
MKLFKLVVHTRGFSGEDLIINPKDFSGIKKGDVVEIYHPEDEFSRLLLQITSFKEDLQSRETISVEQSIATTFQLRTYADVCMNIVSPADVSLDSVELTFKDQYMGRSEMWRLKNSLANTCVYLNKKIEFCGGSIRCQVYEMWSQGDRVACGVITDDTKVVFRSSTSMVYLFIQMSSEMWDFDIHGDLYFEKAVNGFLADLFQKWKKNGSNHEVTIVLFSRTFYAASNLEEFPEHMRECLQQDYKGRFYEDFYRVAVQNERYDDWCCTLVQLRRLFTDYQGTVLGYHGKQGALVPRAVNSTAAQGNFLEVLNMSLNVFEKHYLDRSFDRTGQLSVVITPGVGVFEVDRELTNVTKQRIIDNGVGSDLVCVGEQPLHAVPLLKFHNKDASFTADDYSMPHWINLSFYSTNKKVAYSNFIPRIKLPPKRSKPSPTKDRAFVPPAKSKLVGEDESMPNSPFDYDAYDAQVFQLPPPRSASLQRISVRTKKASVTAMEGAPGGPKAAGRKLSDPDIHHQAGGSSPGSPTGTLAPRSAAISIPQNRGGDASSPQPSAVHPDGKAKAFVVRDNVGEAEISPPFRPVVGSAGSPGNPSHTQNTVIRPGRALINPFDPSHVTIKLTSNRRRWTHIFPKGPSGVLIQQHHYQAVPAVSSEQPALEPVSTSPVGADDGGGGGPGGGGFLSRSASQTTFLENLKARPGPRPAAPSPADKQLHSNKSLTLLWGATGEQEWTPALTTGVDWKSLTIPACLPITTDYFPDKRSLQNDYVVSDYNLLPDDVNADFAHKRAIYRKPLTTKEVFRELVSQRLAQGFQLILLPKRGPPPQPQTPGSACHVMPGGVGSRVLSRPRDVEASEEYFLSIGRVFHKISLNGSAITVTRYRPRHPYPPFNIHYRYRFHAPHHDTYELSWVSFTTEKLENFNWNYLDHYICTRGDTDFQLQEAQKYWRFRMYLLPLSQPATRRVLDGAPRCDAYAAPGADEQGRLVEGFLRFVETWANRIKRPAAPGKKPRSPASSLLPSSKPLAPTLIPRRHSASTIFLSQGSVGGGSPFRERLGSNRAGERPRPRSGSKVMERVKAVGAPGGGRVSPASEAASEKTADGGQGEDVLDDGQGKAVPRCLRSGASLPEILEAMRQPATGVGFVSLHPSLPSCTFVSADAVQWLVASVEGVSREEPAVAIMEDMMKEQMVCHASGDFSFPFVVGFYLYHFVQQDRDAQKDAGDCRRPLGDLENFENEWLEAAVRHPTGWQAAPPAPPEDLEGAVPPFLRDRLPGGRPDKGKWTGPLYKHSHLETDVNNRSDRIEWGHARYQTLYKPGRAYELVVQWVASSGAIVADLIMGWARKAQTCGLQVVPIPADPLALPFTHKSDPLRGPIFVPLDTECLMGTRSYLFESACRTHTLFEEDSWEQRLFLLQEAVLQRFGFLRCVSEGPGALAGAHHEQFVHLTGVMFVLVPSCLCPREQRDGAARPGLATRQLGVTGARRYPVHSDALSSPREEHITRHVSGKNKGDYSTERRTGFLWSWNHMLSRRWRSSTTPATGDEAFQAKFLRDFRDFCANSDNRLRLFWEAAWAARDRAS